ncbi:hypothetical protein [Pseudoalteromonas sp. NBT06-2]|uniref:hypothetical protein n=1 Tax=Pseudoalteromonas sp. NBT06-2 TaxID=2025950 RepID=UPI001BAF56E0|nr:hypothetical protein [Pseudoalteromonas sp. NBT06-2]
MKKIIISLVIVLTSIALYQSIPKNSVNEKVPLTTKLFESAINHGEIALDKINEASGLVASRNNKKAFWTHNDSGDKNRIFLISQSGDNLGTFTLEGAIARDWEDISIGPGPKPNTTYLYVGDIGDNRAQYKEKVIYRFIEPNVSNQTTAKEITLAEKNIETIKFEFPDGKRDAETLMVDPISKDIFVISKREKQVGVYVARYPQSTTQLNILTKVATLDLHKIVAGDISYNGNEVLLKDYQNIYYWKKSANESISELLKSAPMRLPYKAEPQGEAIAWKLDGSGFYTLSEESGLFATKMYFYKRK